MLPRSPSAEGHASCCFPAKISLQFTRIAGSRSISIVKPQKSKFASQWKTLPNAAALGKYLAFELSSSSSSRGSISSSSRSSSRGSSVWPAAEAKCWPSSCNRQQAQLLTQHRRRIFLSQEERKGRGCKVNAVASAPQNISLFLLLLKNT